MAMPFPPGSLSLVASLKYSQCRAISVCLAVSREIQPVEGHHASLRGRRGEDHRRNLNAEVRQGVYLFAGITRHRVPWIQEADQAAAMGAKVIEQIVFDK